MPGAPYTAVWVLLLPKRMILVCVSINTVGTPTRTHITSYVFLQYIMFGKFLNGELEQNPTNNKTRDGGGTTIDYPLKTKYMNKSGSQERRYSGRNCPDVCFSKHRSAIVTRECC
ncbi:hypothetical protein PF005_g9882 [Phytophthora fragariae]|uniref:Secreted protein n=1 Tax=Phytophthora fragariae TaxID=53985 RepID=A0A6A3SFF5_9STRA|nr:hypothetical protein PF007_g9850 [Phytophthora fragariae]KAE9119099.1 hypothetical protein PF010_g7983 [Phytophthora fragariae]KAE9214280.1 hypothetical protein PF005_g9882 [Phytophthora fragariae]